MDKFDAVVIGAGITGLACAHRLKERGARQFVILEAGPRAGGVIRTVQKDGFVMEGGPDAFLSEKPEALDLVRRLGLETDVITTSPQMRRSFVAWKGKLIPLPEGFYLLAPAQIMPFLKSPLFSAKGKLRIAMERVIPPRHDGADESVASFVTRRLGKEALDKVGQPMLAGIYGGSAEKLSMRSVLPRFCVMEREAGSLIAGLQAEFRANRRAEAGPRYGLFLSLKNGMQTLVDRLEESLGGTFRWRDPVTDIQRMPEGRWIIHLEHGIPIETSRLCITTPARESARLLKLAAPKLSLLLQTIAYEPMVTVNLAFRASDIRRPLDGFGFVVPEAEESPILGCSFSSVKFAGRAPAGFALLRAFIGGLFARNVLDLTPAEAAGLAQKELSRYLGIDAAPVMTETTFFPQSMPQYEVGHAARIAEIEREAAELKGIWLAGSAFRGVGLPDCIREGEAAAGAMLN